MAVGDLLTLGLYLVQQLGVMLGVGAALIMLVAHLVSARDGVVEPAEARFARAIERTLMVGLFCIVASGVFITALHSTAGEAMIIFTPAFVFKWLLIGVVSLPLIVGHKHPFPPIWFEGVVGGTWLALFILHVVAPIASWTALFLLYAIWMVVFFIVWIVLARLLHVHDPKNSKVQKPLSLATAGGPSFSHTQVKPVPLPKLKPLVASIFTAPPKPVVQTPPPEPAPKPTPPPIPPAPKPQAPPPPPKPVPPPAVVTPLPQKPAAVSLPVKLPQKPEEKVEDPDQHPGLPAIRVMPRTPEDVDKQHRASVVQFD